MNKLVLEWKDGFVEVGNFVLVITEAEKGWCWEVYWHDTEKILLDFDVYLECKLEAQLACESALRSIVEPVMKAFGGQPAVAEEQIEAAAFAIANGDIMAGGQYRTDRIAAIIRRHLRAMGFNLATQVAPPNIAIRESK